ncbi:two-component system response regulator NarL [Orbaceae bacterium ac157xtp]
MDFQKNTVLLIDDHPMLRSGVKHLINSTNQFNVIAETGIASEGIMLAEKWEPDIILLDINMGTINGLDVLREIRAKNISSRIIMFTVSNNKEDIIQALRSGADGYLLKDMEPEDMLAALQEVVKGKLIMDTAISQVMLNYMRADSPTDEQHDITLLTPREKQIFELLIQGLSNKLIAKELDIVESTVKVHIKSIFKKLNFKSRMEMTVWFLQK